MFVCPASVLYHARVDLKDNGALHLKREKFNFLYGARRGLKIGAVGVIARAFLAAQHAQRAEREGLKLVLSGQHDDAA